MAQPLFMLVSFVLVSFCGGQDWTAPDFCHQQQCPQYSVVETNQDFETRLYVSTEWITTKLESDKVADFMAACSRLTDYCKRQSDAGYKIPVDTWPVLITITDNATQDLSVSWFVPPNTTKPENTDPSVTWQSRPEGTVYVRVFDGPPSIKDGQENARMLREALVQAGKTFNPNTCSGAGYDPIFSVTHHNEIWIWI
ncbi:heme-binding protein 2-like [Micropterus salmoides]|uniref:heme-binding protein 2-like n=1 Tax=Micropterus salmoides TaxID=27706 RepID=UPI0018EA5B7F|nr:heme-binding protein 2-like [Micropterus salmoides]XP_038566079.1 heme-binding protein 2-like [Micropterus salmoides]XP_038566080.1 heme-binding protein 2-like [Micropterus salmoides]